MHLRAGITVTEVESALPSVLSAFVALTGAALVSVRIIYKNWVDPRPARPAGSDNLNQGVFIFSTDDDTRFGLIQIPAIVSSVFVTTGPGVGHIIDPENVDVISFADEVLDGIYTNPFADDLTGLVIAYLQSRV